MKILNDIKNINWVLVLIFILPTILLTVLLIKFTVLTILGLFLFLFFMRVEIKKIKPFKK